MAQGVGPALVFEFKYVVCGGFFRIFTRFFNVSLRLGAQAFQALFGFWGCGWVLQLSYARLGPEGLSWSLSTSFIYKAV